MTDRDPLSVKAKENAGAGASYIGSIGRSETQKRARRKALEVLLILAAGAVLFSPAVGTPLFLDDHLQGAMVEGTFPGARSPLDLYAFVDDGNRALLTAKGFLPWWTDPTLKIGFLRPLSSALLWFDHRVFSHAALPMHLHSLAWWAFAVLAARALFARLLASRTALLATAIFALAPCHALPLAWVANRETLVSLSFGALALVVHARWREQRAPRDALVAGALFALALLGGGEYALSFGGYVLAMDITRRGEPVTRRVTGWAPFVVPALGYLAVRGALGYGTAGSGFYSDPLRDPAAFLAGAPWRAVALLSTGWLTLDPEPWGLGSVRGLLAGVVVVAVVGIVVPLRRAFASLAPAPRAAAVWLLLGSLVAMVPTLAVVPSPRLLGVSMLGIAAVVAVLLDHAWFPREGEPHVARGRAASLAALAALGLGFAHLVHGPGTSWLSSRRHQRDASDFTSRVQWLRGRVGDPTRAEIGVVRGSAGAFFAPFALDARGVTPARWTVLAQAGHVLALRRDARTLDLMASQGRSLFPVGEHNLYRKPSARMRAGDEIVAPGMRVTILEAAASGPRAARFVFDFEPTSSLWLNEGFEATREVELPDVGFGQPFDP